MKDSPSIAVMLAGKGKDDGDADSGGEPGLAEAKASAKDAAGALAKAVKSGDADGVYRAFKSLKTLCEKVEDLEDSGESDDVAADDSDAGDDQPDEG